jgi:hypothetical protein
MMAADLWNTPTILEGNVVQLEPTGVIHVPGLSAAGKDKSIWKYMVYGDLSN